MPVCIAGYEDRGLIRYKYWIKVVGDATGVDEFSLGTKTGSGDTSNGINGCVGQKIP